MVERRDWMQLLAAALIAAPKTHAVQAKTVWKQPLPAVNVEGWAVNAIEVSYGPGEESKPHQHPGFTIGYVLEGEVRFQLRGEPEKIVRTGETFYEPPGSVHQVSGNASQTKPARLLALIFAEQNVPLSKPA